jgi:hypothetical protein
MERGFGCPEKEHIKWPAIASGWPLASFSKQRMGKDGELAKAD